ncbi:hypothetical protein LCL86_10905 [Muricauda ruestringensis]|uniref:Uncharacterized protein n=1 Tax=Flagellimonas marinaquae TaxID=254955 RepID=A0AA48I1P6_9FLAO|nr:hypothetical protein [Allomuricauda ruestringensis]MCA0959554.1 hypothetical protein [Allomuricauda ruestringensis]BDW94126.1 hypothetical protein MACH07_29580 [Allomuricauda aquimarina]
MESKAPKSIQDRQEMLLLRVERNDRMVQRLSQKLNSYTYEPKCPQRFEKFHELKDGIHNFRKHQKSLMQKVQQKKNDLSHGLEKEIRVHLDRFKKLESDFASYLFSLDRPL